MKTDKSFNLTKSTKRVLSTIIDKDARKAFKDAMIDAEASYDKNKKKAPKEKQAVTE